MSDPTYGPMPLEWADYRSGLRRHWKYVGLFAVLGLALGSLVVATTPDSYTAQAEVLVRPAPADAGAATGGRTTGLVNLDTEAKVAVSREVAQLVAENPEVGGDPAELAKSVKISVPPNSTILIFRFTDENPEGAAAGANAFAQAYLANRDAISKSLVAGQAELYSELIESIQSDLAATQDPAERERLSSERSSLTAERQTVLSTAVTPGRLIDEAQPPSKSTSMNAESLMLGGLFSGLLVGLALVFAKIRKEDLLVTPDELRRLMPGRSALALEGSALETPANTVRLSGLANLLSDDVRSGAVHSVAIIASSYEGTAVADHIRKHLAHLVAESGREVTGFAPYDATPLGEHGIRIWSPADPATAPSTSWDVANAQELIFIGVLDRDRRSDIAEAQTMIASSRHTLPMAVVSVTSEMISSPTVHLADLRNDSDARPSSGSADSRSGVLQRPLG